MMKASELRIGNILYWESKNGVTLPQNLVISWVILGNFDAQNIFCKDYTPIQLTEEWLLKFGFEYHHDTPHPNKVYRKNWSEGYFDLEHIISFYFGGNFISVELKYVHQLQNLYFALTGEELTIKQQINKMNEEINKQARELVTKYYNAMNPNQPDCNISWRQAKQCALIAVDELIKNTLDLTLQTKTNKTYLKWVAIKQAIENL